VRHGDAIGNLPWARAIFRNGRASRCALQPPWAAGTNKTFTRLRAYPACSAVLYGRALDTRPPYGRPRTGSAARRSAIARPLCCAPRGAAVQPEWLVRGCPRPGHDPVRTASSSPPDEAQARRYRCCSPPGSCAGSQEIRSRAAAPNRHDAVRSGTRRVSIVKCAYQVRGAYIARIVMRFRKLFDSIAGSRTESHGSRVVAARLKNFSVRGQQNRLFIFITSDTQSDGHRIGNTAVSSSARFAPSETHAKPFCLPRFIPEKESGLVPSTVLRSDNSMLGRPCWVQKSHLKFLLKKPTNRLLRILFPSA